ncbi:MAG: GTP 3',8-cyclase MoaA [Aquificae bacterium]|nr:GTP 3',8-cyclase MoaA [Aquificota bacterium]
MLLDKLGRPLRTLRLSLTDRCNLRCTFCMPPGNEYKFTRSALSANRIKDALKAFSNLGVKKVRLTGGEPLLRKDLEKIIENVRNTPGISDVALTTNGVFLKERLKSLKEAGLSRITVSVHSLNQEKNALITNREVNLKEVLSAVEKAKEEGFLVKVNTVVIRGLNDDEIVPLAKHFKEMGVILRFIEYMDVGSARDWSPEKVVSADEILRKMREEFEFYELGRKESDTALRFRYTDGGEFGIVASVSRPFCRGCDRIRLSADGKLYTCLFSPFGFPLPERGLENFIAQLWRSRADRYSELRHEISRREKVEMFKVGG